ncbi:unnamed protein product, partial [Ectocarpus sp. 8 AP-2014]
MKTAALELLAVAAVGLSGKACAYTLYVTSCDVTNGGTDEDEISFSFCQGGSYCNSEDDIVPLPESTDIDTDGSTIQIAVVTLGFVPTTVDFSIQGDGDAWCIAAVTWEDGENLLGEDGAIWMDNETGELGCVDGHFYSDETIPCQSTWRFFNIDGSSDYSYDFRVKACSGTSSSVALVYFCSNGDCDGTSGEEVVTTFEMTNVDGGWSEQQISLDFNPVAVRLEYDDTWCSEQVTFNAFSLSGGTTNTTDSTIFRNVQYNGISFPTPAPFEDSSDDSKWLDRAWQVIVTVVGGLLVAIILAIVAWM